MTLQRVAATLTAANLIILAILSAGAFRSSQTFTAASPSQTVATAEEVVRTRRLEIVDERGRVRSRINVEADGEVVFRMTDSTGTIRVKLGADARGSGLLLLDEATEPGVHVIARRTGAEGRPTTTSLTLRAGNQVQVLRP